MENRIRIVEYRIKGGRVNISCELTKNGYINYLDLSPEMALELATKLIQHLEENDHV